MCIMSKIWEFMNNPDSKKKSTPLSWKSNSVLSIIVRPGRISRANESPRGRCQSKKNSSITIKKINNNNIVVHIFWASYYISLLVQFSIFHEYFSIYNISRFLIREGYFIYAKSNVVVLSSQEHRSMVSIGKMWEDIIRRVVNFNWNIMKVCSVLCTLLIISLNILSSIHIHILIFNIPSQ